MAKVTDLVETAAEVDAEWTPWRCVVCTHHGATPDPKCGCCIEGHCHGCGQPPNSTHTPKAWGGKCWCCGECEHWPCTCEVPDERGRVFRNTSPWEDRGRPIGMIETDGPYETWTEAWPALEHNEAIDVCRAAADFYLLDALRCGVLNREHDCDQSPCQHINLWNVDEGVAGVKRMAQFQYEDQVKFLDTLFCQYVDMACGGELRHHPAVGSRTISGNRRSAWAGWREVRRILGSQALLDMADLFYDWGREGSTGYGGPLWAKAAEMLHDRLTGKITPDQWVDRVFSLVHNGGVFLNKLGWGTLNKKGWNLSFLQSKILPAHASDQFNLLLGVATPSTVKLWDEYWLAANKARVRAGVRPVANPRAHAKVRVQCRYCYLNPKVGHMLTCSLFTGGHFPLTKGHEFYMTVEEEDWGNYSWETWQRSEALAEVSESGRIRLRVDTTVYVRVLFSRGLNIAEFSHTCSVADLMTLQVKASECFPKEYYRWMSVSDDMLPGFTWKIELYVGNASQRIGQMKSTTPIKSVEQFAGLIIDCGLMLPAGMPELEWADATAGYLASVIHA